MVNSEYKQALKEITQFYSKRLKEVLSSHPKELL